METTTTPMSMEQVKNELDLAELCQLSGKLGDTVASQLLHFLKKLKNLSRPISTLHDWLKAATPNVEWKSHHAALLSQWTVALCMHVPDFNPGLFSFADCVHPIDIVKLVNEELLPQAKGAVQDVAHGGTTDLPKAMQQQHTTAAHSPSCPQCASPVGQNDVFCAKCAHRMAGSPPSCAHCGHTLAKDAAFCSQCGTKVPQFPQHGDDLDPTKMLVEQLRQQLADKDLLLSSYMCGKSSSHKEGHGQNVSSGTRPSAFASTVGSSSCEQSKKKPGTGVRGEEGFFPAFDYNEERRHIVDRDNPQVHLSSPKFFQPNPELQTWRPEPGTLHEMELLRTKIWQDCLGHMYAAIADEESCAWPSRGVGHKTPWGELSHFQKALQVVESQLSLVSLKVEGVKAKTAKAHLGIGSCPHPPEVLKELAKLQSLEAKASAALHGRKEDQGGRKSDTRKDDAYKGGGKWRGEQRQRDVKRSTCFICQEKGHLSYDCPAKDKSHHQGDKKQALFRAMQQMVRKAGADPATGEEGK